LTAWAGYAYADTGNSGNPNIPDSPNATAIIPQRLGVLSAEVFLYDVSAGGVFEYRDDWSRLASRRAVVSASLALKRMGYDPAVIPDGSPSPSAAAPRVGLGLAEVSASAAGGDLMRFFRAKAKMRYHCAAFRSRFYMDRSMYNAVDSAGGILVYSSTLADTIKYSIGPVDTLCDRYGVDGFVYVYGFEEKFSQLRRQALGVAPVDSARLAAGERGRAKNRRRGKAPPPERAFVAAILVGRDGRVLWYKDLAVAGRLDLRSDEHSRVVIGELFE
jgi:hypothetical protein